MPSIYFTEEHDAFRESVRRFIDARAATITAGTSEIMREIISRISIDGRGPGEGK